MTVQKFKPRGSATEEQQSGDILSPSNEQLDNEKDQSGQICYRGALQDSENLLGRVLAGKLVHLTIIKSASNESKSFSSGFRVSLSSSSSSVRFRIREINTPARPGRIGENIPSVAHRSRFR